MSAHACPKCRSSMAEGFILDHTDGGGRSISSWFEGKPQKSFWVGVKLQGKKPIEIATWRCRNCGFLENYARG
jgi:hypothetical protein